MTLYKRRIDAIRHQAYMVREYGICSGVVAVRNSKGQITAYKLLFDPELWEA
jgi:hypothetical protein